MDNPSSDARIAVYLDYENLAIGARESLNASFDFGVVADALAERGRVIARRAYADWSYFDDDRRMLTRHQVELIDIPQKMGGSRKNAADIKLAIDAIELALERDFISTFVICTGDSDLSPLVQKLRELDRRVIGVGIRQSTSKLLPPACDEFLFYDNLVRDAVDEDSADEPGDGATLVLSTLAGLESTSNAVRASTLKRAVLRKDPTFSEADLGHRSFGSLLRALAADGLISVDGNDTTGGDPRVSLGDSAAGRADELLTSVIADAKQLPLTGLKDALRKADGDFDERRLGYKSFGAFVRAAEARGLIRITGKGDGQTVKPPASRRRSRRR